MATKFAADPAASAVAVQTDGTMAAGAARRVSSWGPRRGDGPVLGTSFAVARDAGDGDGRGRDRGIGRHGVGGSRGFDDAGYALAVQPDDRIVVVSTTSDFTSAGGSPSPRFLAS